MSSILTYFSKALLSALAALLMLPLASPSWADGGDPELGEIMWVGFNFAPRGWAKCDGQLLPIAQHTALFSLLGTTYGGDGRTTFALPDMRSRTTVGVGRGPGLSNYTWGQKSGSEQRNLAVTNLPAHNHRLTVADETADNSAANGYLASPVVPLAGEGEAPAYKEVATATQSLAAGTLASNGGGQPVNLRQPSTVLQCIISLQGRFPPRS